MTAGRNDDAGVYLEGFVQALPGSVERCADEISVLPVPMVVGVKLGILEAAAIEVVVPCVVDVRQELAERAVANFSGSFRIATRPGSTGFATG